MLEVFLSLINRNPPFRELAKAAVDSDSSAVRFDLCRIMAMFITENEEISPLCDKERLVFAITNLYGHRRDDPVFRDLVDLNPCWSSGKGLVTKEFISTNIEKNLDFQDYLHIINALQTALLDFAYFREAGRVIITCKSDSVRTHLLYFLSLCVMSIYAADVHPGKARSQEDLFSLLERINRIVMMMLYHHNVKEATIEALDGKKEEDRKNFQGFSPILN